MADYIPRDEWLQPVVATLATYDPDWQTLAACAGQDTELWYGDTWQQRAAIAVCEPCDARPSCTLWALAHNEDQGVWGGLTAGHRRQLRPRAAERRKIVAELDDTRRLAA